MKEKPILHFKEKDLEKLIQMIEQQESKHFHLLALIEVEKL